jgi:hypothetical protein
MKIIKQWFARQKQNASQPGPRIAASPLLALEPRVVYDASVAAVAAQPHAHEHAPAEVIHRTEAHIYTPTGSTSNNATANAPADKPQGSDPISPFAQNRQQAPSTQREAQHAATTDGSAAMSAAQTQVVFIDPSVANYQVLIAGLPAGTQYVVLDAKTDGLAQIAQYLQAQRGVESISLLSHGSDGAIQVGSTWLTNGDLSGYSTQLAQIGAAMHAGGDFLIYGCDVAQQADGQALVQKIAGITHLNVAASIDATGSAALGGNWTLEYQVGNVHTALNESASAQAQFNELLGVTTETYDSAAADNFAAIGLSQFTLDGLVYTFDQPGNTYAYNASNSPFPSDISVSPTDGVLDINADGASTMSNVTISLANGHQFSLQSFDLSSFNGDLYIQATYANGSKSALVQLATAAVGGFTGTVSSQTARQRLQQHRLVLADRPERLGQLRAHAQQPRLYRQRPVGDHQQRQRVVEFERQRRGRHRCGGGPRHHDLRPQFGLGKHRHGPHHQRAERRPVVVRRAKRHHRQLQQRHRRPDADRQRVAQPRQLAGRAAVDHVLRTQASPNLSTTTRTVSFAFNDGTEASNVATRTITVTSVDQTPLVTEGGATSTSYFAGSAAVAVDANVHVSDADTPTLTSGAVTIASGYATGDTLAFNNSNVTLYGNIIGSYNATTHALTLTSAGGTATVAQWQNAFDAVTFASATGTTAARATSRSPSATAPRPARCCISMVVTAGPTVSTDSGSAQFVSGDNTTSTPVAVDPGILLTDGSSTTLVSATVAITGNFQGNHDQLLFTANPATMGNISGAYDSSTGVLTLTARRRVAAAVAERACLDPVHERPGGAFVQHTHGQLPDQRRHADQLDGHAQRDRDGHRPDAGDRRRRQHRLVRGRRQHRLDGGRRQRRHHRRRSGRRPAPAGRGHHHRPLRGDRRARLQQQQHRAVRQHLGRVRERHADADLVGQPGHARTVAERAAGRHLRLDGHYAGRTRAHRQLRDQRRHQDQHRGHLHRDRRRYRPDTGDRRLVGSLTFTQGDNVPSTPVVIDSGITVSDRDNATLTQANVVIASGYDANGDTLLFTNDGSTMGNITGAYSNGVLALSSAGGTATLAQWQAAPRSALPIRPPRRTARSASSAS